MYLSLSDEFPSERPVSWNLDVSYPDKKQNVARHVGDTKKAYVTSL